MKQSLNLKLQHKLNLTLSLKVQINLLTLPKVELTQEILQELQENPFLEEVYTLQHEYEPPIKDLSVSYEKDEEENSPLSIIPYKQSLRDIIENQISLEFESIDRDIALEIVDSIDDRGFFKGDLSELSEKYSKPEKHIENIRRKLTQFEPLGLASKDLQEFFLLQLDELPEYDTIVESIIMDDLDSINDTEYLSKKYNLPQETVIDKINIIKHFRPYPLYGYEDIQVQYVEPDIFIYIKSQPVEGDFFEVVINEMDIPKINFVNSYKKILSRKDMTPQTKKFLMEKYERAIGIIKGLAQRRENLYNLVKYLAEYQRDFLLDGKDHLKPLTLKEVSEKIGLHESTISRIASSKYAVTPQGVLPLKSFFASRASKDGGNISSESVKYLIKSIIEKEDRKNPLSDSEIVNMLKNEGINIARRTIAKYREEMHIPDSRKRKIKQEA